MTSNHHADTSLEGLAEESLARIELPEASREDRAALRESIRLSGVLVEIVVSAGPVLAGEIADGRARREICAELAIPCRA